MKSLRARLLDRIARMSERCLPWRRLGLSEALRWRLEEPARLAQLDCQRCLIIPFEDALTRWEYP